MKAVVITNYRSIHLEVITRLFSYRPLYQARASATARDEAEGCCRLSESAALYHTIELV